MPAYVIANIDVHDAEGYREYTSGTQASIESFGGRFVVRGGEVEVREGAWQPNRLVVVEFDSLERARRWYESEEYQRLKAIREANASTDLIIVQGAEG